MQYDTNLIQQVLAKVQSLSQMTLEDRALLFPKHSSFDVIADGLVTYKESKVVEHRFKGMMSPQPLPIVLRLYSDFSEQGMPKHHLEISHSLDVRASPYFATVRTYSVDHKFAGELATLHRVFYERQNARHVLELNHALEQRQLMPAGFLETSRRRRRDDRRRDDRDGLAPSPRNDGSSPPPAPMHKPQEILVAAA